MKDEEIVKLIKSGKAILFEDWIKGDSRRRIGEYVRTNITNEFILEDAKRRGIVIWVCDFKLDDQGVEYAGAEITLLPKSKSRRRNIVNGINAMRAIAGLAPIDFLDQNYIYVEQMSAKQIEDGIKAMRENWPL